MKPASYVSRNTSTLCVREKFVHQEMLIRNKIISTNKGTLHAAKFLTPLTLPHALQLDYDNNSLLAIMCILTNVNTLLLES